MTTDELKAALALVSGALVDDGEVAVPDDPLKYGEAIRQITARAETIERETERNLRRAHERANAADAKMAEADRATDAARGQRNAAEADARALREALEEWVEARRSLLDWMHDKSTGPDDAETDRRYARVEAAERAARAVLSAHGEPEGR